MIEYDRTQQNNLAEKAEMKICVAGVGGAGSNVLDRIKMDLSLDADLITFHTDVRVLNHGMAPTKVQLGGDLMKGVGAGGDPDLGREASLFSKEQIRQALHGREIVFICTGLGGGTGSGAAPVVAEIAKNSGALVIVLATMPFSFEGRRRLNQAEEALELLQKRADALILFDNNRMGELVLPKEGIQRAFTLADQTLAQCARAVTVMVSTPGLIKLGLDDLVAALNASNGRCLFGFGEGKGQNRGTEALKKALKSPLIDSGRLLQETKNLLVHIVGGDSLTLAEVDGIMKQLGRSVPEETQILFGLAVDSKLGDAISVTLISSLGLEQLAVKPLMAEEIAVAPKPVIAERKRTAVVPPPPAPEPAPEPEIEEPAMELFADAEPEPAAEDSYTEEAAEELEQEEEQYEEPVATEPEEEFEEEEPVVAAAPPVVEPEPVAPPPASVIRSRKNERQPSAKPRGVLASVLSSPSAVASHVAAADKAVAQDDEDDLLFASAPASREPVLAGSATSATGGQQSFRLGDEDRGRFKDTEPSISDGEDLDVPTWMRLRKKVRQ